MEENIAFIKIYIHFKRSIHEPHKESLEVGKFLGVFATAPSTSDTVLRIHIMLSGQSLVQCELAQLHVLAGLPSTAFSGDKIIHTRQGYSHWCQFCNLLQEYEIV